MDKTLIIVESPTKAKTISKYLGNNYIVKSSIGHIRDLSNIQLINKNKKLKSIKNNEYDSLIKKIGVNPWNNWEAYYKILPDKENIVYELKNLAKNVDRIYLATDLDREGEAIAWHLREVIGGDIKRYSRITFNEITKKAIYQALKNPREIDINLVNAQQARRFMDRIVGYMISPLLWKKIAHGLSAGRVQSVALRLIVERELKIKEFKPKEYWKINAHLISSNGDKLLLNVTHRDNIIFQPKGFDQTTEAMSHLENACYYVFKREDKIVNILPKAPFITSKLQQVANNILGFSAKKTMILAQKLYEAGYITYMRTDSYNLSQDAINMARNYIINNLDKKYLPNKAYYYQNNKNSQESHEAIRPSNVNIVSELLKNIEPDARKLYHLIWCQFIACQMTPAKYKYTTIIVKAGNFKLKGHWKILHFDGWMRNIPGLLQKVNNQNLPIVNIGDKLSLVKLFNIRYFTHPPFRFNEASLIKELEKRGIGRPSTYASIVSVIQNRGYVSVKNGYFYTEKIGEIINNCLKKSFSELIDYSFTSNMENQLDKVANNKIDWKILLDNFFINFINQLNKAKKNPEEGGM